MLSAVVKVGSPAQVSLGYNEGVGRAAFLSGGSGGEAISLPFKLLDSATLLGSLGRLPPSSAPATVVSLCPFSYSPVSLGPQPERVL